MLFNKSFIEFIQKKSRLAGLLHKKTPCTQQGGPCMIIRLLRNIYQKHPEAFGLLPSVRALRSHDAPPF